MNIQTKIIDQLKTGLYNISEIERRLNIPEKTLFQAIKGSRNIPKKFIDGLKELLKII
jgi:hypothetical protein